MRPPKPAATVTGKISSDAIRNRQEIEQKYRGEEGIPDAPEDLTPSQREIWDMIVNQFCDTGILGRLDGIVLRPFCVSVDAVRQIDLMLSENPSLFDSSLPNKRKAFMADVWKGVEAFCLSPQARAKLGSIAQANREAEEDPLLEALKLCGRG